MASCVQSLSRQKFWSKGNSYFGPMGKAHRDFLREGRNGEARALEYLAVNKSWPGHRILTAVGEGAGTGLCERCGLEIETPLHRHYTLHVHKNKES